MVAHKQISATVIKFPTGRIEWRVRDVMTNEVLASGDAYSLTSATAQAITAGRQWNPHVPVNRVGS